ncbi:MAG: metallophosphoesterase family protein [Oscillospiraceae bacterium]|nr:metallophosphoesterase family protein [Oscillospiraceae bacterium]
MKIMVLADEPDRRLWDLLDRQLLKEMDILIACGDLPAEYLSFLTCFTHAPVLYVCGNHDESYEKAPPEGCFCIEDQVYCCKGLRIVGLGGSMRYRPGLYQYTEAQMRRRAKQLSLKLWRTGGFDILVTHAPARGIGDEEHISHRGFQTFVDLMEKYKPAYMVHGHIHREYTSRFKRLRKCGETVVVNANKSYVIEIDDPVPQPKRRR